MKDYCFYKTIVLKYRYSERTAYKMYGFEFCLFGVRDCEEVRKLF